MWPKELNPGYLLLPDNITGILNRDKQNPFLNNPAIITFILLKALLRKKWLNGFTSLRSL